MRWIDIRRANIPDQLRQTFERYGPVGMQIALNDQNHFVHQGQTLKASSHLDPILGWLTEKSDEADRKATWSLAMEVAITLLVGGELIVEVWNLFHHC